MHSSCIVPVPWRRPWAPPHACALSLLALCSLCAAAVPALAQGTAPSIRGTVVEDSSSIPLGSVEVWLVHDGKRAARPDALTDADGHFSLSVPGPGRYSVFARRIGFAPTTTVTYELGERDDLVIEIRLPATAVLLAPTTVTGRPVSSRLIAAGFEARRARGVGAFFTREMLQRRGNPPLETILREVPGVRVATQRTMTGGWRTAIEMGHMHQSEGKGCPPAIIVDGQRAHGATSPEAMGGLLEGILGETIEGIEVYRGLAEIPAQFAEEDARCGAIVIWTRQPGLDGSTSASAHRQNP